MNDRTPSIRLHCSTCKRERPVYADGNVIRCPYCHTRVGKIGYGPDDEPTPPPKPEFGSIELTGEQRAAIFPPATPPVDEFAKLRKLEKAKDEANTAFRKAQAELVADYQNKAKRDAYDRTWATYKSAFEKLNREQVNLIGKLNLF